MAFPGIKITSKSFCNSWETVTFALQFKTDRKKLVLMANHASSKKRIRQDAVKRLRNRYYKKSARTAIARFRALEKKDEAYQQLPQLFSMIDGLAKRNLFHANKAANLKSGLSKFAQKLA